MDPNNDDDFNNPFEKEDFNEESSNPLSAEYKDSQLKNSNVNNNSFNPYENNNSSQFENKNNDNISKNNIQNPYGSNSNSKINNSNEKNNSNPYEANNNNNNDDDYNPYGDDNSNPYAGEDYNNNANEVNNNDNPFEKNNENNPFENNFEENDFSNNQNINNANNNIQNENSQKLPSFDNFEEVSSNPYMNKGNNDNNFINYGGPNNYQNNFGGPQDYPNNGHHPNPFGNNPKYNNQGTNNNNNPNDAKKIKAILDMCIALYNQSLKQYDNFNIKEAMKTLCKSIKGLDGLKQTIQNKKTSFNSLIPKITSLRNKAFSNLQEYRINIYLLINLKFKPVEYDQVEPLLEFAKRYILTEPFISFDDVFDPALDENKKLKFVMNDYFKKAQRLGYKNLLLYGPKGSGKTLAVHALAYDLKAKLAQINGLELFKIPYFSKEFVKAAFSFMQNKPLIVYIKNIEKMFSNMNNFNFIYDRVSSSKMENIIFIASTQEIMYNLPKEVSKKFHYSHCIRPAPKNQKFNYIRFLSQKIGIKINLSDQDLNNFAFENLINYSNEDIFYLLKSAIEIKRQQFGNDEENRVYKEGLNYNDIMNALKSVKGSLQPSDIKNYYL